MLSSSISVALLYASGFKSANFDLGNGERFELFLSSYFLGSESLDLSFSSSSLSASSLSSSLSSLCYSMISSRSKSIFSSFLSSTSTSASSSENASKIALSLEVYSVKSLVSKILIMPFESRITYLIYSLGRIGLEVVHEVEDTTTWDVSNIGVVVKITLELLTMAINIPRHATNL